METLVGTWKVSGETDGALTYEWMDGGFYQNEGLNNIR